MADSITVRIEGLNQVIRRLQSLDINVKRTLSRAVNDTATHARSEAIKGITREWNIKAKDVRSTFNIKRATPDNPVAELSSKGRPIPLLYFAAKQTRKGTTYKVKKRGGREVLERGWINRLRRGVAVGIRRSMKRLPITAPAVPGVYHAWGEQLPEQAPKVSAFLLRRIEQLIKRELERRG
jgi:hypothetical protein